jgi:hypothetical protein
MLLNKALEKLFIKFQLAVLNGYATPAAVNFSTGILQVHRVPPFIVLLFIAARLLLVICCRQFSVLVVLLYHRRPDNDGESHFYCCRPDHLTRRCGVTAVQKLDLIIVK